MQQTTTYVGTHVCVVKHFLFTSVNLVNKTLVNFHFYSQMLLHHTETTPGDEVWTNILWKANIASTTRGRPGGAKKRFIKLPKDINVSIGEKSANLVTLLVCHQVGDK
jgi:hypothetical protein